MDTISRFFGNGKKNRTRKKASAALPGKVQRGGLALESLEARTTPSATVFTDLLDYQPGDTALITAKDFAAGSTVEFQVLHVNGNNGGQGHIPWRVTDGSQDDLDHTVNGVIQTCWYVNPDDSQGEAFVLTALGNGPDMTFGTADDEKASTTFTDAFPGVTLNQWETLDHKWANGQANTNQTRYLEGDTVPYAAKFTNLTAGNTYGFIINLNTYQQNTNAGGFIYLDSYNRSVNPNSTAFGSAIPGSDLSVLTDGNYASQTSQSSATFSSVDANVTTVDIVNGTGTGSLDRYAKVVFTASSSTAVIYWGQRLALPGQVEWSAGNFAPYGAASFTGGSLQTKIDGSGNSGVTWITPSNAVQLMQGVVVQGSIQGLKWNDLNNNGIKDSGEPLMSGWTIQLFSDLNTDGVFDSGDTLVATQVTDTTGAYKFSPVVRGTYFVQEVGQSGWDQTYPRNNNGVWGPLVVDENTPNYTEIDFGNFSPNAKISINKVTKDGNAIGDGITVLSGEQIQWVYTVTNPGNVPLSGVVVTDSKGVEPAYVSGDSNSDGKLQNGESWVFQAIGTSILGAYSNIGTATGAYISPSGKVYSSTASDASNYVGVNPVISIDKVTVDGVKSGDGLKILSNEPIKWRYTVTNPGAVVLSGVVLVDSISGVVPAYVSGDSNSDGKLQNGESWVYEASGTSILGAYSNTGTASGNFSDDAGHLRTATASDSSNYVGVNPVISIDKVTVDGVKSGDGLTILSNEPIKWRYTVTNPGAVVLSGVVVVDSITGVVPAYVSGDSNSDGKLQNGESWVYEASGTSILGAYSNTGTASGSFSDDAGHLRTATASDSSNYVGVNPVIAIDKVTVDGVKSGDGLTILSSEPIKWRYTVTNPGAVVLSSVVVVDSITGVVPAYVSGDSNSDGKLQNGESWVYEASGTSILGAYSNTGTASGSFSDDAGHLRTATASDSSNYVGVNPVIAIDKVTAYNGSEGDGLHIPAGAALEWKYYVTNPGAVPLANVQVKDDNGTPTNLTDDFFANYVSGDTGNGLLDPGETWVFDKSGVSNGGAYSNTGTATGDFSDDAGHLRTATAKDASSYFGEFQFTTVTLGGWGATPSGNNPGTYLNTHFTSAFDNNNNQTFDGGDGLVVPRPNITTVMKDKKTGVITTTTYSNDILLHTADDVRAFLRATNSTPFNGMTVDGLSVSGYRPTTLEKQYVALTLNVTFDAVDSNFGISGNKLGDLKLQGLTGSLAQLNDMTIQGVLDVVGACLNGSNSYGLSPGDLTMLLGSINEAFDGGHESNWAMIHLH